MVILTDEKFEIGEIRNWGFITDAELNNQPMKRTPFRVMRVATRKEYEDYAKSVSCHQPAPHEDGFNYYLISLD